MLWAEKICLSDQWNKIIMQQTEFIFSKLEPEWSFNIALTVTIWICFVYVMGMCIVDPSGAEPRIIHDN